MGSGSGKKKSVCAVDSASPKTATAGRAARLLGCSTPFTSQRPATYKVLHRSFNSSFANTPTSCFAFNAWSRSGAGRNAAFFL
eukprot:903261-Rhodomonas_salina.1